MGIHARQPGDILFGETRTDVLRLLYGRPAEKFYLRQIVRSVGKGVGGVQRDLEKLTRGGLLSRTKSGNQVFYQANSHSPVFREVKSIIAKIVDENVPDFQPIDIRGEDLSATILRERR